MRVLGSLLRYSSCPSVFLPCPLFFIRSCHTKTLASQEIFISNLVLNHSGLQQTLSQALEATGIQWTPGLVDSVMKRLWNHGPKALLFFESLSYHPDYAHSPSSFDLAIDIAARLRDNKKVWSFISRLRKCGFSPSPRTFAIICERYVSIGKPHRAVKLFLSMHHHNCPQTLSSFNTILDILCKSKHVELAVSLFKTFKRKFPPDVITYNIIANGWCIVKRTSNAMEVLREMVEVGLVPTIVTYNLLLKGFFRAGQVTHGYKFFVQMRERGGNAKPDVVTYTTVIHGLGVNGDTAKARKVLPMMIRDGCLPSVATYNVLIQLLCKKDTVENAIKVFEDMIQRGYMPNIITFNVVIRGLCHVENFDRAMEYMEKMKANNGSEPNVQTFNILIRYLCEAGELEKAFEVFRRMADDGCLPNLDSYNVLISGSFAQKKAEWMVEAGKLLVDMVERGFLPRRFIFNRVLNGLLLTGNQAFAKEILSVHSRSGHLPRKIRL
ncbi:pentatricopeptide repeat-containing protein At1g74900, mitochondrial [Aristolochia californica]|uniref:pentatricopeptide repeat-containing protein At1g74900, mitochondrial n=1 Tax=Aristolochia californica TaxID=171875 RepID=UPI0035DF15A0